MVISIGTIDHIYDARLYLNKIFHDIKPGGLFYIEVPNDQQWLTNLPKFKKFMYQKAHYYSFTFSTLQNLLENCGFKIEESFSRHDYNLINFINWSLNGKPLSTKENAQSDDPIFSGIPSIGFEREISELLINSNTEFNKIITKYMLGESICMLARKF